MLKKIGAYVATGCVFVGLLLLCAFYEVAKVFLDFVDMLLETVGY